MIGAAKVKELEFSELYLGHPCMADRFSDLRTASVDPLPAAPALRGDIDQLTELCRGKLIASPAADEFKMSHDGITYRVTVMRTLAGILFVLRKVADTVLSLAELGIPQAYTRQLMTRDLSGLLIVSGTLKAGKTTTACGIVRDRLIAYGGVAVTAEDPIELPLEGCHGQGVCFQTRASRNNGQFADAFRKLTRLGARIVFVDEIRDADTAWEVLQASLNGHLIVTTMLAESVIQTITKLHALASERMSPESAQLLMADGLVAILHQQIVRCAKPKLETEFLFFKNAPVIRTVLRNGKYDGLASDIKQQMSTMIAENAAIRRIVES